MKPHLNTFLNSTTQSFQIGITVQYHALNDLHYHSELEIVFILEGTGTLLVGEQFEDIGAGMLLVIGPNTPHMFKFDKFTYLKELMKQGQVDLSLKLLTLHLDPGVLGEKFLLLPENQLIKQLIEDAGNGISFVDPGNVQMIELLYAIMDNPIYERMPLLIKLLNVMGANSDRKYLSAGRHQNTYNHTDENRLTRIYLYTLNNFTKTIILKDVAAIVYMVPNAFCRYFKQRTHKSYFNFLTEIRIRHACKLLKEHDYSMVVVCYESGFSNLSNFNRHFKQFTGKSPLQFRHFVNKVV